MACCRVVREAGGIRRTGGGRLGSLEVRVALEHALAGLPEQGHEDQHQRVVGEPAQLLEERAHRLDRAPRGEGFVAIDLLGRERSETVDWFEAEETLDELGIRYLAAPYELVTDSGTSKVYIAEATPDFVRVKEDDFNDINSDQTFHTLPFPVPEELLRELPGR